MQLLNNNPIYRLLIPKPLRTYFWKKYLSSKIINSYKNSNDLETKEIILNIKKNGIQIISSTLSQEYDASKIKVYYDESCYVCSLEINAVRGRGEACGIEFIDISSPDFNKDGNYDEPLKATFEKYKDKVTIVNKMFSNKDSENTIDGGKFLKDKGVNFLKIDVDGFEEEVMNSLQENLKTTKKIKIALCTYHADTDYKKYKDILENYNFKVSSSKGYMIYYWDKNLKFPYLRRGVLRAEK